MDDWKRRLLDLAQVERERETVERKEATRVAEVKHQFLYGVVLPAFKEVGLGCQLIGRSAQIGEPQHNSAFLTVLRNDKTEFTFELEAPLESSALLWMENGRRSKTPRQAPAELLNEGETLADLTVNRVRGAVLEVLEKRLRGEL